MRTERIDFEYVNKLLESLWRATVFYVSTGKPGRKLSVFTKLRGSRKGVSRVNCGWNLHCPFGQQCATLIRGITPFSIGRAAPILSVSCCRTRQTFFTTEHEFFLFRPSQPKTRSRQQRATPRTGGTRNHWTKYANGNRWWAQRSCRTNFRFVFRYIAASRSTDACPPWITAARQSVLY